MAAARPSYPLRTKIIVIAVLIVAVGAFTLAIGAADTGNDDGVVISGQPGQVSTTDGIDGVVPADGAEVLSQQSIGIDLAQGWTGELTLRRSPSFVRPSSLHSWSRNPHPDGLWLN